MGAKQITVNAEWDAEAKVWVASSDNVLRLITEAATTAYFRGQYPPLGGQNKIAAALGLSLT